MEIDCGTSSMVSQNKNKTFKFTQFGFCDCKHRFTLKYSQKYLEPVIWRVLIGSLVRCSFRL